MKIIKNCFWALIPARSGSKKIKNKNLLKLNGKPLIAHSIKTANSIKKIDQVFFSSDSLKYLKIAKKYGCKNLVLRKKTLSKDRSTDFDVFKDFVDNIFLYKKSLPEYIIHLRPTTPIRKNKIIIKAINCMLKNKNYSSLRSVSLMTNPSYKTFRIKRGKLCSIIKEDYSLDKYNLPKEFFENTYLPNGYVDIIKTNNIKKNFMHGNKVYPFIVKEFNSDIDDYKDYISVKKNIND